MADFVAVIRRAVDGLTDNNPEMRVKVYDKARGAVRRQLEAMNPRPPEEMLQRQLDKLESAIVEVEAEHSEALPPAEPEEAVAETPVEEPRTTPPAAGVSAAQPAVPEQSYVESGSTEPEHSVEVVAQPAEVAHAEPVEPVEDQPARSWEVEPVVEQQVDTQPSANEPVAHEEVAQDPTLYEADQRHEETADSAADQPVDPVYDEAVEAEQGPSGEMATQLPVWEAAAEPEERPTSDEPTPEAAWPEHNEPAWQHGEAADATVEHVEPVSASPAVSAFPSWQEPDPVLDAAERDFQQTVDGDLGTLDSRPDRDVFSGAQDFGADPNAAADPDARMPSTDDPWHWPEDPRAEQAGQVADSPPVQDVAAADPVWAWPEDKAADAAPVAAEGKSEPSAWNDLEELIGYDRNAEQPAAAVAATGAVATETADAAAPARDFRVERRSPVNYGVIAAVAGVLLIAGGAGAGYWFNRDAVNAWFAELTSGATTPAPAGEGTETAAETTEESTAEQPALPSGTAESGAETEVALAEPANGKFTQRLTPDGSEVDEGPAPAPEGVATEEGKSVAEQTPEVADLGADGAGTTAETTTETTGEAPATTTGDAAATTTGAETLAAAASTDAAAVGVAQKMFLYEERLGQTAPTAIEGSIAWSTAEESQGGDAKPEPVIRGQINVPSRDLTALLTIRRNTDASLPASHIVEVVFSLPDSFEGGSIESVQRVAMKRTEQDRGDPLIAVPAKITEDFHMIALNDFAEAIARNTELLRDRNWIDIPITYRNGRRALITLDKGASGVEAFDTAMKAWAALGTTSANSQ